MKNDRDEEVILPQDSEILLSLVVPCYNESIELSENYIKACNLVNSLGIEIVFVDNGSTDDTWKLMTLMKKTAPKNIAFVRVGENAGYGHGIKQGLLQSKGDYIGWTHGDGQTDLMDVRKAFHILKSNPEVGIVKGMRKNRPILETITSSALGWICSLLFMRCFSEINAQPSIYKAVHLKNYNTLANNLLFDVDSYIYAHTNGASIMRFSVDFPTRKHGKSSWNTGWLSKTQFILNNLTHIISLRIKLMFRGK
jgi:polyisoprenyl-phosphate glycosyltransferase